MWLLVLPLDLTDDDDHDYVLWAGGAVLAAAAVVVLPLLVFVAVCTSFYRNGRGLLSITIHIVVVNKLFFSGLSMRAPGLTHSRISFVCTYI